MGINLAKLLAKNLRKYGKPVGVKPATLLKVTAGTRGTTATAGTNPTMTSYPCTGWIEDYTAYDLAQTQIVAGDRRVSLLGATIGGGVIVPAPSDKITIADPNGTVSTYTIVDQGVRSDGVGAVYTCQVRR